MQWDPELLRRVKQVELEALLEIKRICEKNGIRYFLDSGTLLGAVRHKGFIPWDDDIDVTMPWKDYRRFCRVCKRDIGERFFLQNYETDYYGAPFAKLRVNGTTMMGVDEKNMKMHTGIWVDIFPLVGISGSEKKRQWMNNLQKWRMVLLRDDFYRTRNDELDVKVRLLHKLPLGLRRIIGRCIELYTCRDPMKAPQYSYYFPSLIKPLETAWIRSSVPVEFEGHLFDAPADWDAYLTRVYGDYMQLPPEDKRQTRHNLLAVDCDRDYSEYRALPDSAFPALQKQ